MKRPIKPICADAPKHGLSLVPCGLYLNKAMKNVKPGDVVVLGEAWCKQKRVLVRKCYVDLNTSIGNLIVKHIYGDNARVENIVERWEAECVVEDFGKGAIGEVLLIETRPYDAELEEMEDELAYIEARKAELKQMLDDARKGVFNHKDIL